MLKGLLKMIQTHPQGILRNHESPDHQRLHLGALLSSSQD